MMICPGCKNEFIACVCMTEESEIDFHVNLYWQEHYRREDGKCGICLDDGRLLREWAAYHDWCICPEGMKRRKEESDTKSM